VPDAQGSLREVDLRGRDREAFRSGWLVVIAPLIYPKPGKVPVSSSFVEQVSRFQQILLAKRRCVVLGYSFRDAHVAEWFVSAFHNNRELKLILVDRNDLEISASLIERYPNVPWGERLLLSPENDISNAVKNIGLLGLANLSHVARYSRRVRSRTVGQRLIYKSARPIVGMTVSADGRYIYVSTRDQITVPGAYGSIEQFDLSNLTAGTVIDGLRSNRGLAVTNGHRLFVVVNRVLSEVGEHRLNVDSRGYGAVFEMDWRTSILRPVQRMGRPDRIAAYIKSGRERERPFPGLFSWPNDLSWSERYKVLVISETRGLGTVEPLSGRVRHSPGHPLTLNMNSIALTPNENVLGLELGISQARSWGRVIEFEYASGRYHATPDVFDLGLARLFDLAFTQGKVLLAECLPDPAGSIVVHDYPLAHSPGLRPPRRVGRFDYAFKILCHPTWNFVLCADRRGIHEIPLSAFT
jgi:hypothetical protein